MLLTLDFGNTKVKSIVFEQLTIIESYSFNKNETEKSIDKILKKYTSVSDIIISSVLNNDYKALIGQFKQVNFHIIDRKSSFPFNNHYQTPNTIGIDRLVLAAGAVFLHPNQNRLVIDTGSCITYDFIDQNNNYLGGAISPGLNMRYKSVHQFTEKLPLLTPKNTTTYIGNATDKSIHVGITGGITTEIDGFINLYKKDYSDLTIILTGGDCDFLAKQLKNSIFADVNFLAKSLLAIYHNETPYDKKDNS